jgi:DNA-binding SARP family transcriptional activator
MIFRILGPLAVEDDGRPIELGGARQRAVLAILLLHRGNFVPASRLIDDLYGEQPPATAAKSLQVHLSRLRKALGEQARVESRAGGYALRLEPHELDADRFDAMHQVGREALAGGRAEEAKAAFDEALSLWRGPPLADVRYEDFAQAEIARLLEARLAVEEDRFEAKLTLGRHADVVGELEHLISENPFRERLRGQLMTALYRCGRQAEALEAYQAARRTLVDELGIEPGRRLRELETAVLVQDSSLDLAPSHDRSGETADSSRGAFVGREAELGRLLAGLDDALAGRGKLFLLEGEPGIGKSRLADELIARARARGARILVGRCWEAGGAPAYWPWVQSLRAYVRESATSALRSQLGAGAADVAQIVPELRQRLPDLPEPPALESDGARFRLFDATADFLRNASASRPIVLMLDDLHAADASSLLLLQFLARELGSTRMLVLGAFRDVDPIPGAPLQATLAEVGREPVTRRLSLGGLTTRDVAEYVELTASEIASPELAAALHRETEGNPLFVGETVRLLALEGVPAETATIAIPQSVRDVISRRLAHLSEECNRVLVQASGLGREFAVATLARIGGLSEDEVLETLDEAMSARVVSDVPGVPGRLRFAHVLIRDTLYEGLTAARRVRLHRQAVTALETLYGDEPGAHLAELAHHSIAGSDFGRGLRYAQRAGDRAVALLAYEEAARLYETALEALDQADPSDARQRCELLLSLGAAEARAGDSVAADKVLLKAAAIARRLGLSRELARAAADYGGRMIWTRGSDAPGLLPLLEEGLAGLTDDDVELRARLLARLAGALRDEVSRDRRDKLSREAIEVARQTDNPAALAHALDGRSFAILAPDTLAECMALGSELRALAERIGYSEGVVHGYMETISAQVALGDIDQVKADLDAARRIAAELRQPALLWDVCGADAMLALAAGRLAEGEELVEQSLELGERALPAGVTAVYWVQRYTLCDFRGDVEELEPMIRGIAAAHPTRPVLRCVLAHLHARVGRLPEARAALDDLARDDFAALPFDQEWLLAMSLLAETAGILDDTDSAAVLYRLLVPWAGLNVADQAEAVRGAVARYLGILAATLDRWEEAERHFENALAMNERMGFRPWLAHTQLEYAQMLLARDRPGDSERAQRLREQARAIYRELGMESYAAAA